MKELLKGRKDICNEFELNHDQFYAFLRLGMPVRKINGRWWGYRENISKFFQKVTIGRDLVVNSDEVPGFEDD